LRIQIIKRKHLKESELTMLTELKFSAKNTINKHVYIITCIERKLQQFNSLFVSIHCLDCNNVSFQLLIAIDNTYRYNEVNNIDANKFIAYNAESIDALINSLQKEINFHDYELKRVKMLKEVDVFKKCLI